mmetsp:Transcript_1526/g.3208  ORF Transcript_1526/g.3208 Transcript_1526/m.3208 type:complete len:326 (+) Transcript_1526:424-1401(+)
MPFPGTAGGLGAPAFTPNFPNPYPPCADAGCGGCAFDAPVAARVLAALPTTTGATRSPPCAIRSGCGPLAAAPRAPPRAMSIGALALLVEPDVTASRVSESIRDMGTLLLRSSRACFGRGDIVLVRLLSGRFASARFEAPPAPAAAGRFVVPNAYAALTRTTITFNPSRSERMLRLPLLPDILAACVSFFTANDTSRYLRSASRAILHTVSASKSAQNRRHPSTKNSSSCWSSYDNAVAPAVPTSTPLAPAPLAPSRDNTVFEPSPWLTTTAPGTSPVFFGPRLDCAVAKHSVLFFTTATDTDESSSAIGAVECVGVTDVEFSYM